MRVLVLLALVLPRPLRERFLSMTWLGFLLVVLLVVLYFVDQERLVRGVAAFHDHVLAPVGKWWMKWMPDGAGRLFAPGSMG